LVSLVGTSPFANYVKPCTKQKFYILYFIDVMAPEGDQLSL
jgi:hypothetical protein